MRVLRWAGHVVRMDYDRLPRKLLFSWVRHRRPRGRPSLTFGHRLDRVVKAALGYAHPNTRRDVNGREGMATRGRRQGMGWVNFAKDRQRWRYLVHAGSGDSRSDPTSR